jgi:cytochrome c556
MKRTESETLEFLSRDRTRLVAEISTLRDALRKIVKTERTYEVEFVHNDVVTIAEEALGD